MWNEHFYLIDRNTLLLKAVNYKYGIREEGIWLDGKENVLITSVKENKEQEHEKEREGEQKET